MNTFFGFKLNQTQDYDAQGLRVPITVVKMDPSYIISAKTPEKNGYSSWQIALGNKKNLTKPLQGLFKNLSTKISPQFIREIKTDNLDTKKVGDKITVAEIFAVGDKVKVTGTSIGKGFAGVVKRHGFHGGPKTHGQSTKQRHAGSIGQTTTPGRVYRGKKMAGHMGGDTVSVSNLEVFAVKEDEGLLLVKGLVPGHKGALLKVTKN